jgi:hypothetical protein
MLEKPALNFLIQFVCIADFGKQAHNYLGRKREPFTGSMIDKFLQGEWCEYFALPCFVADPIGALIRSLQRS